MSETGEGINPEEVKKNAENAAEPKFDQYGQIIGGDVTSQEAVPFVDSDDLPENQGMTPTVNLGRLKAQLDNSEPFDINSLKKADENKNSSK